MSRRELRSRSREVVRRHRDCMVPFGRIELPPRRHGIHGNVTRWDDQAVLHDENEALCREVAQDRLALEERRLAAETLAGRLCDEWLWHARGGMREDHYELLVALRMFLVELHRMQEAGR